MAWNAAALYPQGRHSNAGVEWNDLFIACGGTTTGRFSTMFAEVYSYDFATDAWTARNNMPITRCEHAVVQVNGEMFVFGGQGGGSSYNTRVDKCVMSSDTWSTVTAAPYGARWPRAAVNGSYVHLIGGETSVANAVTTHARYDTTTDTWSSALAVLPAARSAGALVEAGGSLYYLGGVDILGASSATVYVYDTAGDSWSTGPALPVVLTNPQAWTDAAGAIWVTGGSGPSGEHEPLYKLVGGSWTTVETVQPSPRFSAAHARVGSRLHRACGGGAGATWSQTHYYWQLTEATTRPRLRGGQVIYDNLRGGQRWN